jgi:hypothetical protein
MEKKPKVTVEAVNEVVKEAGDMPKLTEKQRKKLEQRQKQYWNSMITRAEAFDMVENAVRVSTQQNKLLSVQVKALTKFIIDKGLGTEEELNEIAKQVMDELYGPPPELKTEQKDVGSGE